MPEQEVISGMATILTNVGNVVTAALGWTTDVLETVMGAGNELMLLAFILPFVGLGIGFLKRLTR